MGNFYTNVVVRGPSEDDVVATLASLGRTCFVAQTDGFVFVYDQKADKQTAGVVESIALTLATRLKCPALAALNHDDNVLLLWLYEPDGTETRFGWGVGFEAGERSPGIPEFAAEIRRVFGTTPGPVPEMPWKLRLLYGMMLRLPLSFAVLRHNRMMQLAGIPVPPTQLGYNYVYQGELSQLAPGLQVRSV